LIRAALWLALLLGAIPALLFGASPARATHTGLVIGVASYPSTLHPSIDPDSIKFYILGFVDRPLTAYDPDRHLQCLLCTEIPTIANGGAVLEGQGMAVTWHFKPGLTWGDGAPLGAADLAFTARAGRDPTSGFFNTHTWSQVSRVDVVDPLTAIVHLTERNYQYDAEIGELLPAHLEQPVFDAAHSPGEYMQRSLYNRDPTNPGLYNGPYRIASLETGSQLVLERNTHWTGDRPFFDRIVIRAIGNTAALQSNLLSGDIDMVPGDGIGLTLDQVLVLQKQYPTRFTYAFKPNLAYAHVDLQLDNPILADVRVRRALLLGLDRQAMVDKLMGGRVPVANSFVNPQEPEYTTDVPTYPFDPARARALLAEAGWKPSDDGVCRNAAGQRLSLEFSVASGARAVELRQEIMQSQWRSIGVETVIRNQPARTLFGETLKHRAFAGMAMFGWSSSVETSPRQVLSSGQIPTAANNWGGTNYTDFHNSQMDADIDALDHELDPAKRLPLWAEMQRIYADQLPVLPLFFGSEAHVWPNWLKGVVPTGHNQPTSLWAEHWTADD
jgi:peptide/nickel transport system substrate-binding protein